MSDPRFGVNYVPGRGWWYSWVDWDDEAIAADLDAVARLGSDHIRIHCLWPLFQPNPNRVSAALLGRLSRLFELADASGLDVIVTVFDGWLSGFDFRPSWLGLEDNVFVDRWVVDAELRLLDALAARVGTHPRFLGFDLANEPNVIAGGPGREAGPKNVTTAEQGDAWVVELLAHCETVAPGRLHHVGMDHRPWLVDGEPFTRATLGRTGALTPVHAWIYFTGALARYGPDGTGTTHLAEYCLELAKAFSADPGRLVWLQEFGASSEWLDDPAAFLERAGSAALSVDGLWGLTWWCSHDIDRELTGFVELEYDLGLLTTENAVKPAGKQFRQLVDRTRSGAGTGPFARSVALVLDDEAVPDLTFADTFFALVDQGVRPAIVLASRVDDAGYLAARGISEISRPDPSVRSRVET